MKLKATLVAAIVAFVTAIALPASAMPVTLYDGSGLNSSDTNRNAEDAPLAFFRFAEDLELTGLSQLIDPDANGNAKFLIFEGDTLAFSQTVSFTDTGGLQAIASNPFSFSVTAGVDYFIGAILDVTAQFAFSVGDDIQGSITNFSANQNVDGFANPVLDGQAGAAIAVSLLGGEQVSAVPVPAALPLLISGLAALGFLRYRRKA